MLWRKLVYSFEITFDDVLVERRTPPNFTPTPSPRDDDGALLAPFDAVRAEEIEDNSNKSNNNNNNNNNELCYS
eukprot:scaffold4955_cov204-Amphora_coffeaeformis.AAC.3